MSASPSRPPIGNIRMENYPRRCQMNYATLEGLSGCLQYMLQGSKFKYLSPHKIELIPSSIIITSIDMPIDDILEIEPLHDFAERDVQAARAIEAIRQSPLSGRELPASSVPAFKPSSNPRPDPRIHKSSHGNGRTTPDGYTSLQQLCDELKIEPRIARQKLRSSSMIKPEAGWSFPPQLIDQARKVISS